MFGCHKATVLCEETSWCASSSTRWRIAQRSAQRSGNEACVDYWLRRLCKTFWGVLPAVAGWRTHTQAILASDACAPAPSYATSGKPGTRQGWGATAGGRSAPSTLRSRERQRVYGGLVPAAQGAIMRVMLRVWTPIAACTPMRATHARIGRLPGVGSTFHDHGCAASATREGRCRARHARMGAATTPADRGGLKVHGAALKGNQDRAIIGRTRAWCRGGGRVGWRPNHR